MKKKLLLKLALLLALFFCVGFLNAYIEKFYPPLPQNYEESFTILDGEKLRLFCFGMEGLVADYYWMQTLQYLGRKILIARERGEKINIEDLTTLNPKMLYPLLDNVVGFDPKFTDVYLFASVVLPAVDLQKAIEITEKGIRNSPQEWRLYHYLGFIYWKKGDYEKASEIYQKGASIDSAPAFMKIMSAKVKADGGSRNTAREIYKSIYQESQSREIKESVALRLLWLDALDQMDIIRKALQNFKAKNNICVRNWEELIKELRKMPEAIGLKVDKVVYDPTGVPYQLDKENCDVNLDALNTKLPLR